MHEIVQSGSSTPQCEEIKQGIADSLHLLQKWNLLELQNIFREHEISLRSLIYLTDNEICELIPKIGVRTIFRAMLTEWRQTYNAIPYTDASTSSQCDIESDSFLDQIELKTECNSEDSDVNNLNAEQNDSNPDGSKTIAHNAHSPETNLSTKKLRNFNSYKGEPFDVLDILNSCVDGQTVLDFYKVHKFLDVKNRKRIVNILIRVVVERKVERYTAIFHDMTRQLLELFPSEKYETYFVPHNGPNSARGALYYRYSNYTRQLRKEGLLAYKKHKPKN